MRHGQLRKNPGPINKKELIQNRLGYNGGQIVVNFTTDSTIITKIETHYRPSGSAVFTSLDCTYQDLQLSDCTDVTEYAERLWKSKNKLLELNLSCTIRYLHLVNKFLTGLGPDYDVFLATSNQTRSLISHITSDGQLVIVAVTFDKVVMAAKKRK